MAVKPRASCSNKTKERPGKQSGGFAIDPPAPPPPSASPLQDWSIRTPRALWGSQPIRDLGYPYWLAYIGQPKTVWAQHPSSRRLVGRRVHTRPARQAIPFHMRQARAANICRNKKKYLAWSGLLKKADTFVKSRKRGGIPSGQLQNIRNTARSSLQYRIVFCSDALHSGHRERRWLAATRKTESEERMKEESASRITFCYY